MKHLMNKFETKEVPLNGGTVKVRKLSIKKVKELQKEIDAHNSKPEAEQEEMEVLALIMAYGIEGADKMKPEDFECFAVSDLKRLSEEIMRFAGFEVSGLGEVEAPKGN